MRDIYRESNRNTDSLGCDVPRWCGIARLPLGGSTRDKDIQSVDFLVLSFTCLT
jgi:hypothetical protein